MTLHYTRLSRCVSFEDLSEIKNLVLGIRWKELIYTLGSLNISLDSAGTFLSGLEPGRHGLLLYCQWVSLRLFPQLSVDLCFPIFSLFGTDSIFSIFPLVTVYLSRGQCGDPRYAEPVREVRSGRKLEAIEDVAEGKARQRRDGVVFILG